MVIDGKVRRGGRRRVTNLFQRASRPLTAPVVIYHWMVLWCGLQVASKAPSAGTSSKYWWGFLLFRECTLIRQSHGRVRVTLESLIYLRANTKPGSLQKRVKDAKLLLPRLNQAALYQWGVPPAIAASLNRSTLNTESDNPVLSEKLQGPKLKKKIEAEAASWVRLYSETETFNNNNDNNKRNNNNVF